VDGAEPGAELNDGQLAEEITLLGEVMSAVTAVGAVMTQAEIDAALGVHTLPQTTSHRPATPRWPSATWQGPTPYRVEAASGLWLNR
jgi:hypothetical protein